MGYLFIAVVVICVGVALYKAKSKRKFPSNDYTPFDDITSGRSDKT
ncbi:hypothetical protein [Neobacillus notoginsengisoli]|nr:hypothetical protein [Neobacillus notoginsengisoli]